MLRVGIVYSVVAVGCGRVAFDPRGATGPSDAYSSAVVNDGAVGYWRLDETSGTTAFDVLGTYNGEYVGGCTLGAAGALSEGDAAVQFDGSSCRIEVGDVLEFAGMTAFTIEVWAKPTKSDGSVRWLVAHQASGSSGAGYAFLFQDRTLWFEQDDATGGTYSYVPTQLPSLGVFHQLVVTTTSTSQTIYVDGLQTAQLGFTVSEAASTGPLVFGDYLQEDPNKFEGTLDEVALYDRALDAATIAAHYATR